MSKCVHYDIVKGMPVAMVKELLSSYELPEAGGRPDPVPIVVNGQEPSPQPAIMSTGGCKEAFLTSTA